MAVPLPFRTPVTVVDRVIAGVVAGFATVPARPLALTTDALVTVPDPPPPAAGWSDRFPAASEVRTLPDAAPTGTRAPLAISAPVASRMSPGLETGAAMVASGRGGHGKPPAGRREAAEEEGRLRRGAGEQ